MLFSQVQFVFQCLRCLKVRGRPRASEYEPGMMVPWIASKPKKRPTKRKREQARALRSARMRALRKAVLARDNHTCRICGDPGDQLYHTTIASYGNESPKNTLTACRDCNGAERQRRIVRRVLG